MHPALCILIVAVASFLLGSIPWGLIISKTGYHKDLRDVGSGNIGTTNAIRALGKKGGYAVFVLDFVKGILSGVVGMAVCWYLLPGAGLIPGEQPTYHTMMAVSFLACILGHIFTPWLHFKGGKGIAVGVGCMIMAFGPIVALVEVLLFAVLVVATKHVSVGSIAAAIGCLPASIYAFWGDIPAIIMATAAGAIVVWAHRGNIKRLREGTESRIGKKKQG